MRFVLFLLSSLLIPLLSAASPVISKTDNNKGNQELTAEKTIEKRDCSTGDCQQAATNIAQKAAQEAKAAQDAQNVAGQQAAHQVKTQLASRAAVAARAAAAALAGKRALLAGLETEAREAEAVLRSETQSQQRVQSDVSAAVLAAQQAAAQLKSLVAAEDDVRRIIDNILKTAKGAKLGLREKTVMVEVAKAHVDETLRELYKARTEYIDTKQAVMRAESAAKNAKLNASPKRI